MRLTHRIEGMTMNYQKPISSESLEAYRLGSGLENSEARSKRLRWFITGAVLIVAILAATWFLTKNGDTAPVAAGNDNSQAPTISVITPGRVTIEGTITATGTLAARREMPVGVAGEGGRVGPVRAEKENGR